MRRSGLALALCAALLVARAAGAAEKVEVIVVRAPGAGKVVEEATIRLEGELRAVGFAVRSMDGAPGVEGRAQADGPGGAFATIALHEADRGAVADAWIADGATKKALVRRVDLGDLRATNAASDLAIRAAELLRVSLLELSGEQRRELPEQVAQWIADAAPPPVPATAAAAAEPLQPPQPRRAAVPVGRSLAARAPAGGSPAARAPSVPRRRAPESAAPRAYAAEDRRLGLEAGLAVLAGGVGAVPGPYLRVEHGLPAGFSLRVTLVPAVLERRLDAPAGSVALRQTAAMGGLAYAAGPETWRVYPVASLGAGVYWLTVEGRANPPYRDRRQDWLTGGLSLGGGLGVRVLPHLTACAELDVLLLAREPVLTIAGAEVGRMGRPALLPRLGLQLSF
ncbi:hypothetical protein [Sorangium sp. So ce1389]|uniref:hypothetical protein n=1 Tax=Sorangium sp. So ce1389 TaxID=3133336 RepID=UPI003F6195FE